MNSESQSRRGLAVITGATGGVGLEIAKGLAQAGYAIVLGARSEQRGTEAVATIRSVATRPDAIQHACRLGQRTALADHRRRHAIAADV